VSLSAAKNCFVTSVTAVLKLGEISQEASRNKVGLRGSLGSAGVSHPWPLDYFSIRHKFLAWRSLLLAFKDGIAGHEQKRGCSIHCHSHMLAMC
jgi:hypothetical protein